MQLTIPPPIPEGRPKLSSTSQYNIPGVEISTVSTRALAANRIQYTPIYVKTTIVIDQVAIEVTTAGAAGKLARVALYNTDVDWQPTSKVFDAGTVAVDPGTPPTITTASVSATLAPGRYLVALISDGTPTLRVWRGGSRYFGLISTLNTTPLIQYVYVAGSGTTLPDPGTAWTSVTSGTLPPEHLVVFRVSAP